MKPLEGVKVIDLTQYLAAPASCRVLAEWGADVIKVEGFGGDPTRTQAAVYNMPYTDDENLGFDFANFNKRFISINLKTPEGMQVMDKLLQTADIFVSSMRTKSLAKLGLDWDTIKEKYPQICYGQIVGYGEKGAEKDAAGYDVTCFCARGGIFGTTVNKGDAPMIPTNGLGDFGVGVMLAGGLVTALFNRTRTGKGDKVVIPLQHAGLFMLSTGIVSAQYGNQYPKSRMEVPNPLNNVYRCKDGNWIVICLPEYDRDYDKVMKLLGMDEWVGNTELNNCSYVNMHGLLSKVIGILDEGFAKYTLPEALKMFKDNDYPCEPANTPLDIYKDQNVWDNDMLLKYSYPSGERIFPTNPVHFDSLGTPTYKSNGMCGAQTDEIMAEYGFTPEQTAQFKEAGAIKANVPLAAPVSVEEFLAAQQK
ncbi:MAG: CoA transferase [Coriobacteriales bacterium]|jgi:crotonobetainyl-CoA:carnitine CoA-transferase CaiB-like acyl-CoA transferase|nr:CoA transferase [Coriobacteriales bacterium]